MEFNIKFLIVAYFVSLFVDWVFQAQWQAWNKSKWEFHPPTPGRPKSNWKLSALALLSHSFVYAAVTAVVTQWVLSGLSLDIFSMAQFWWMFAALFISHAAIDSRIPVKWVMHLKGMTWEEINDVQTYGFMHIGIDHRLHELVLFAMAFFVK